MDRDKIISEWTARFGEHELSEVTPKTRTFKLSEGGKHIMSCLITFTPEGITISGDITPTMNGTTSTRGYDMKWFAGELHWSYLAEKFLKKKFIPELAVIEMKRKDCYIRESIKYACNGNKGKYESRLRELDMIIRALENGEIGSERLAEELYDLGVDPVEGLPGWGYHPNEVAILVGIQRRFKELYKQGVIHGD